MPLRFFAWIGVGLILLPLIPGVILLLLPATSIEVWQAVAADPQIPKAFVTTLVSSIGSTLLALLISSWAMMRFYPSKHWTNLQKQTPFYLSFPHAAFAIGFTFLFAPSGWFARLLSLPFDWQAPPQWITIQDPWGISLMLVLALKESWFLLWVMFALPGLQTIQHQMTQAQSMGYARNQIWWQIVFPQILPKLSWALLSIFAYSLSVVDLAIILGPSTPPTLAVLGWQWFTDFGPLQHDKASVVSFILLVLLLTGFLIGWLFLKLYLWFISSPSGVRKKQGSKPKWLPSPSAFTITISKAITLLVALMLLLWSFAGTWFFPEVLPNSFNLKSWYKSDFSPLFITLCLAITSVVIVLPATLLWLEWGPKRQAWLYFPLILPPLTLAAAQFEILLHLKLDNTFIGVVWSHLAWVMPYMLLVLAGSYRAFDERYYLRAQTLGYSQWCACLYIKWPMLIRPILAACAVGFSVSVAQYLPTLFAGGGRFETVTTEAVALSAGGNRRILAIQTLLQALLPLVGFMCATIAGLLLVRNRKGMQ